MTDNLPPLLPCPFCGGEPALIARPDNIDGTEFICAVACYCGGYSATAHKMERRPTPEQAKADTTAAWNRRAALAQAQRCVPAGWAVVPPIPDDAMLEAFAVQVSPETDWHGSSEAERQEVRDGFNPAYAAMIAASPQPQPVQPTQNECIQYLKDIHGFLESTCPKGFADEVFRLPPSPTRSQELLLHAIKGDADGKPMGLERQDSGHRPEDRRVVRSTPAKGLTMTDEELQEVAGAAYRAISAKLPHEACLLASLRAIEAAATAPLLERIEQKQARIDKLIQEVAAGADVEAEQRARIAALEAKLAHRVPDGGHPMQPVVIAIDKVHRFLENKMVNHLYEWARDRGMGLNEMAVMGFSDEDRMQFAQLIGYSASGYGGLSFVTDKSAEEADRRSAMLSAAPAAPEQQEPTKRCPNCDDTGDVHGIDGEWRGSCHCPAGLAPNAKQAEPPAWNALVSDREYLRLFDEARHGSTGGFGVLRGIRACIAAYEAATPAQQAEAQEPVYQYRMSDGSWIDQTKNSHDYNVRHGQATVRVLFARPQPAQLQALSDEEVNTVFQRWWKLPATNHRALIKAAESALAAKNGAVLK